MRLLALGIDHQHADVGLREQLAVAESETTKALAVIAERFAEGVLLSTCNRTELYLLVGHERSGRRAAIECLAGLSGVEPGRFEETLVVHWQEDAVRHLFRVAGGLESQILGEHQILGQVRDAAARASAAGTTGALLTRLFRDAVAVGKRARTETGIARNAVSISSAAVELTRQTVGALDGKSAVVIGAGRMGALAAQGLVDGGVRSVVIASRTRARAEAVANRIGGRAIGLSDLGSALAGCDVVISATASESHVVTFDLLREARTGRNDRTMVIVDIAVPRDVDPKVSALGGCRLFNVDDLNAVRDAGLAARRAESQKVEALIEVAVGRFMAWWQAREVTPTIADLIAHAEAIRAGEVDRAMGRLGELSDRQRNAVNALTTAIVNKMLHDPIVRLKERGGQHDARVYVHAVQELFGLPGRESEPRPAKTGTELERGLGTTDAEPDR